MSQKFRHHGGGHDVQLVADVQQVHQRERLLPGADGVGDGRLQLSPAQGVAVFGEAPGYVEDDLVDVRHCYAPWQNASSGELVKHGWRSQQGWLSAR